MIQIKLKIVILFAIVIFFVIVLSLLKHKRIALKYTLLWLFAGVFMLVLVIFPEILVAVAKYLNVQNGLNVLYVFLMAFIMMILMSLTSIVSKQTEKIRVLVQDSALLEKRIREMECQQKNKEKDFEEEKRRCEE